MSDINGISGTGGVKPPDYDNSKPHRPDKPDKPNNEPDYYIEVNNSGSGDIHFHIYDRSTIKSFVSSSQNNNIL